MEKIEYLPLGSIVRLENGIQKLLIIGRGLNVKSNDKVVFFDYGGVLYPDGLTGDQMAYFNHDAVSEVIFRGYSNDEDQIVVNNINQFLAQNPGIVKGTPDTFR